MEAKFKMYSMILANNIIGVQMLWKRCKRLNLRRQMVIKWQRKNTIEFIVLSVAAGEYFIMCDMIKKPKYIYLFYFCWAKSFSNKQKTIKKKTVDQLKEFIAPVNIIRVIINETSNFQAFTRSHTYSIHKKMAKLSLPQQVNFISFSF